MDFTLDFKTARRLLAEFPVDLKSAGKPADFLTIFWAGNFLWIFRKIISRQFSMNFWIGKSELSTKILVVDLNYKKTRYLWIFLKGSTGNFPCNMHSMFFGFLHSMFPCYKTTKTKEIFMLLRVMKKEKMNGSNTHSFYRVKLR